MEFKFKKLKLFQFTANPSFYSALITALMLFVSAFELVVKWE